VLGPIIRAEVGDKVIAHFRNRAFIAGGSYGMHPHGFRYTKDNEGAHCRQEREQKFLSEGSLITSGLPTKTAARVWAIPARSCGGITLT
jgi:hypothetical protein